MINPHQTGRMTTIGVAEPHIIGLRRAGRIETRCMSHATEHLKGFTHFNQTAIDRAETTAKALIRLHKSILNTNHKRAQPNRLGSVHNYQSENGTTTWAV
jgi:hypothetical protein